MKTKQLVQAALFVGLIAIAAQIKIPLGPVPFTLQLPMVILCGLLLGTKTGVVSLIIYTLIGLLGVPVFAGAAGLGAFVSPTFGFILGYIPAVLIFGLAKEKSFITMFMWTLLGMAVVFLFGTSYFAFVMGVVLNTPMAFLEILFVTVIPFLIKDIALAIVTVALARTLENRGLRLA
ncbi:biotin transporter BioY [Jeotgalicoccus huakuii]|uniref:biotin transporter BioY n=1 Tax=Jeotgalicoccus TaxID=227979 RepID=UPI00042799FB|nr:MULTISPECIES: biotin transporter BioY [Jeotgalicoccus]MCK1976325.1 biotin transporter BioY [Jeotgalicoccus huakuii]QQD85958.1 biotin transporter BioY [Jeotgalicoccus sp. ATCC 8456]